MTRYLNERTLFGPLIAPAPSPDLSLCVVIPARDEGESLVLSLESLRDCHLPESSAVEVIVVINTAETDPPEAVAANRESAAFARDRIEQWGSMESLAFHVLECHDLPRRHAGVGLARKIGMDEACRRLETVGRPDGVIACFDADSACDPDYLAGIVEHFASHPNCQAASLHFEHPLSGENHPAEVYEAIAAYELHLRYFVNAQRFAGCPFAIQTIGSSMAVRCDAYQAQNGMNRRQAGEDFYFLHKFTPLGRVTELNSTRVIPSPRRSHRVPFGTGKAVGDLLDSGNSCLSYSPRSFEDLRRFLSAPGEGRPPPEEAIAASMGTFLESVSYEERLAEIESNVTTPEAFRARFFRWFNAFQVMKYVHHARDRYHPDVPVNEAATWLLEAMDQRLPVERSTRLLLERWREIDRARC